MAIFHHIIQPLVSITHSNNVHTVDFDKPGNNYSITANNATNSLTFSNLDATRVGKSGTIIITNPSTVTSLGWNELPDTAYTPGGGTISFNTSANKIAVITYFIAAADKVLINYVGDFGSYPQP